MPIPSDAHQRMLSAYQLFQEGTISVSTFEHIRTLIKGIHPKVDKKLEQCSKALDTLQKIQNFDVITLSAERLPEDTEEKKKKKKALLFFISSLKDLQTEIQRIDKEFVQMHKTGDSMQSKVSAWGRIIRFAKGPAGIVTIIALVFIGIVFLQKKYFASKNVTTVMKTVTSPSPAKNLSTIQVITYNGKQIPLSQLYIGHGADCDSPHYHATTGSVTTIDGTVIPDPENCGYGKVKDVKVSTINVVTSPTP